MLHHRLLSSLLSSLLLLLLLPAQGIAAPSYGGTNQTFTLTVIASNISGSNPDFINRKMLVSPPTGIASLGVGSKITPAVPFKGFIYKGRIYRKCSTSPTGACLGFLTKEFAGALTGWDLQFSDNESPYNLGPGDGPIIDGFAVNDDPDTPTDPNCNTKHKLLYWSSSRYWTLCGSNGAYYVNSMFILPDAHNGPLCSANTGYKFKVKYTK